MILDEGKKLTFLAVVPASARAYADAIWQVALEEGIDPFIIVALGERESAWGATLSPRGPGGTGDAGHGHGLLQIDDKTNGPWLAANDWADPYTNVKKGIQILKSKIAELSTRVPLVDTGGFTASDGQRVNYGPKSAARFKIAIGTRPDPRPLDGNALMLAAFAAYNAGSAAVVRAIAAGYSPDFVTTGGDYSSWVASHVADLTSAAGGTLV